MAEIAWTDEAKSWLQKIYDYIARDNEEAAWQVILGIYELSDWNWVPFSRMRIEN